MVVTIVATRRRRGVRLRALRSALQRALELLGEADAEVCVSLVGDGEIRALNGRYRGKDKATDVLAFASREGERVPGDEDWLGDIVISLDTAQRQAQEQKHSLSQELTRLAIHGLLHLLGYDHERSAAEARKMRRKEKWLLEALASTEGEGA
ncbi:Endoribonuclease YbeY [bacterium HR30]|nr:Endoribonuclease YbeY [bacterium HR30]